MLSFVDVNVWEQLSQKAEAYVSPCAETGVCNPIDTAEPRPPTDWRAHVRYTGCPKDGTNSSPERILSQSTEREVATISINLALISDPGLSALQRGAKGGEITRWCYFMQAFPSPSLGLQWWSLWGGCCKQQGEIFCTVFSPVGIIFGTKPRKPNNTRGLPLMRLSGARGTILEALTNSDAQPHLRSLTYTSAEHCLNYHN